MFKKGLLLTFGITCLSIGVDLIKEGSFGYGLGISAVGISTIVLYIYFSEKQIISKLMKLLE